MRLGAPRRAVALGLLAGPVAWAAAGALHGAEPAGKARWEEALQEEARPAPGVRLEAFEGARRLDVILPGRLLDAALPRRADGRRDVVALVAPIPPAPERPAAEAPPPPCDAPPPAPAAPPPRLLVLAETDREGGLTTLQDGLPGDVESVEAVDLDGDLVDEIVVGRPGELWVVRRGAGGAFSPSRDLLLADAGLRPRAGGFLRTAAAGGTGGPATRPGGDPLYHAVLPGAVRFYLAGTGGPSLGAVAEASLPVEASHRRGALTVRTPLVRPAGRTPAGAPLLASGPEAYGGDRLRTILVDPAAPAPDRSVEAWSRLPGPEETMESAYLSLDGSPALAVVTRPADELSFFREKSLRLFPLGLGDRSRGGSPPLLAVESHANLWQRITFSTCDVDGDGRQDLVLGYWKGLKDTRVVLDVHLRLADGSFARSPRTTEFDVEDGDRSMVRFGDDLDGDGRGDLLLVAGAGALIFPGSPRSREGARLVGEAPRWTVPLEGVGSFLEAGDDVDVNLSGGNLTMKFRSVAARWPRLADLDADGRPEILFAGSHAGGVGSIQVIALAP